MAKRALVTGVTGQDGAYLARLLLLKGYEVIGCVRPGARSPYWRLRELNVQDEIEYVPFELLEYSNLHRLIEKYRPDEIYNLAAISFVAPTFEQPIYTSEVNGLGVVRLLESIREVNPEIRFYQASTSEMFGSSPPPQSETTNFHPRSPYACAKVYAHNITTLYREAFGLHATCGILFNHESPLRGEEFVTRKITKGIARIARGENHVIKLGNLSASRDWGFAAEYVEGIWSMVQQPQADTWVLATGESFTVLQFVNCAARAANISLAWNEDRTIAKDRHTGKTVVEVDSKFVRPADIEKLVGDFSRAKKDFNWHPRVTTPRLATIMVESDLRRITERRS